ncbi:MAG TPA: hypothetical protein VFM18_05925 [Methanosarcina sp.]|nr:hypothetical protein [Methanosarcina sp.]
MNYIKIKEDPNLGKDPVTGGIVSLNTEAYFAHMKAKKEKQNLENRLENIEKDVQDIKTMFSEILKRLG